MRGVPDVSPHVENVSESILGVITSILWRWVI